MDIYTQENAKQIAQFEDEVAEQTGWRPLKGGGQNFGSHKLKQVAPNRLEFKSAMGAKLFCILFMIAGAFLLYHGITSLTVPLAQVLETNDWLPIAGGLMLFLIGSSFLGSLTKPIVFDKEKGMFWKGKKTPQSHSSGNKKKDDSAPLRDIHALQIISESVTSSNNNKSFKSVELNLVFKDSSRMNVIDHGNTGKIQEDAQKLSEFLGVPVWDASTISDF